MWTVWVTAHRGIFYGLVTLAAWLTATSWYFKVDLQRMIHRSRPHSWTADMQTKTGTGGPTKSKH